MEDDSADEDDFQAVKPRKYGPVSHITSSKGHQRDKKPRRTLSFSPRATQCKKKMRTIETFFEKSHNPAILSDYEGNELGFCPVCQLPLRALIGLSVEDHVHECVTSYSESSVMCPYGVNCDSVVPCHFKKYSHQKLASFRSLQTPKNCSEYQEHKENELTKVKSGSTGKQESSSISSDFKDTLATKSGVNSHENIDNYKEAKPCLEVKVTTGTQSSEKENLHSITNLFNNGLEPGNSEMPSRKIDSTMATCPTNFILNPAVIGTNSGTKSAAKIPNDNMLNISSGSAVIFPLRTEVHAAPIEKTKLTATNILLNTQNHTNSQSSCSTEISVEKLTCNSPRRLQKLESKTCKKQMEIGPYFGLKAKRKFICPENKADGLSTKVIKKAESSENNLTARLNDEKTASERRKCPFYKIVEGTSFAVDAFSYGHIPGISAYFLSHFHYDHYGGLKKSFAKPIYCSQVTANLVLLKINVAARFVHPLPLRTPTVIENIEVILLEANHCPGAVMFLFKLQNGQVHLHTGDFRASSAMQEISFFNRCTVHTLYLDTTYCNPSYSFPPQSETIKYCVSVAAEAVARNAKTLIVVGAYTIGKEKIFIAVANALQSKVAVQKDKYKILQCLESAHLKNIITQDYKDAQIHILSMAHLNQQKLEKHLESYSSQYSELLAFKPTGWTYSGNCGDNLRNIKPLKRGVVTIYGVPYSEHSSFEELKQFVQFINPRKIIPTVNNGSAKRRKEMESFFKSWLGK